MIHDVRIEQVYSIEAYMEELSELLIGVVADGASIGFLPPLSVLDATNYWKGVLGPGEIVWIAWSNNRIAGSVQLHVCGKQNGRHRAEIAKLMTHPDHRRKGIGRLLLQTAEERAVQEGISLIVLDTREGDPSNELYCSLGYIQAGRIPRYARSANGELDASIFYYKNKG